MATVNSRLERIEQALGAKDCVCQIQRFIVEGIETPVIVCPIHGQPTSQPIYLSAVDAAL